MRHRGTKRSKLGRVAGYAWYDRETGAVDLCLLAADATRDKVPPHYDVVPAWLSEFPATLSNPTPSELARVDARARRAYLERAELEGPPG